jgi:hypothetical protein
MTWTRGRRLGLAWLGLQRPVSGSVLGLVHRLDVCLIIDN